MSKKLNLIAITILLGIAALAIGTTAQTPKEKATSVGEKEYLPEPDVFIAVEQQPEMIYEATPAYPPKATKSGIEEDVYVKSLVNKNGEVVKAMIAKPSNDQYGFDEAALEAAYKCKYKPAIKDGKPVAVWITYKVSFVLDNGQSESNAPHIDEELYPEPDQFVPVEKMPEMIYEATPVYPPTASKSGIEATVYVKSLINKKGEVVKAMIAKSSNDEYDFDQAALDAAYKCKYKPALQNGQPVATWVVYSVKFALGDDCNEKGTTD